ncbi:hypothetical protein BJ875DRAFT_19621 [Amylocarpus encephaloides]|uniref:Uncharacterized protein n=1 Tax=Amylocarpus encephaloides TaxID=45428 RepID=A0A9P8C5I7_9HELO|nr:hypothetical protein BJ875DRAFT_19621 [Amylocarpus encephaloides]
MTNFRLSGPGLSVTRWLDHSIELDALVICPTLQKSLSKMDIDDPLDWDTDRIVKELCTSERTWRVPPSLLRVPLSFEQLEETLRSHGFTGWSFCVDFNEQKMHRYFPYLSFGQESFFWWAQRDWRGRSRTYQTLRDDGMLAESSTRWPSIASNDLLPDIKRRKLDSNGSRAEDITEKIEETGLEIPPAEDASSGFVSNVINIDGKERKRIAPTLITSVIDPSHDRTIPTHVDHVSDDTCQRVAEQAVQPGTSYTGPDGKKRLVPISISRPDNGSAPLIQETAQPSSSLSTKSEKSKPRKNNVREIDTFGYLGGQNLTVDDVFYAGTSVGEELSSVDDNDFCLTSNPKMSIGRRLYVNKLVKSYLRSDVKHFSRNDRSFYAVTPYSSKLKPRFQKSSFTLFEPTPNGEVHARRAEMNDWPEVRPDASAEVNVIGTERTMEFQLPGIRGNDATNDNALDPDSLYKYLHLDGGETVLPVYGESDSENEFDEKLWREIEGEATERGSSIEKSLRLSNKPALSNEEVVAAVREGIDCLALKWKERKLPKRQLAGFKIWQKARKRGTWKQDINNAQKKLAASVSRLDKMEKAILAETWTQKRQVLKQATIMELDVFSREESKWTIALLVAKKSPERLAIEKLSARKVIEANSHDEEGESLRSETEQSSSDDDMDDFIAPEDSADEEEHELNLADSEDSSSTDDSNMSDGNLSGESIPIGPVTPSKKAQIRLRVTPSKSASSIAVAMKHDDSHLSAFAKYTITPTKIIVLSSSDEGSTQRKGPQINLNFRKDPIVITDSDSDRANALPLAIAVIASVNYKSWSSKNDARKLLIAVIGTMNDKHRQRIFKFISDKTERELWKPMRTMLSSFEVNVDRLEIDAASQEIVTQILGLLEVFIDCKYRRLTIPPSAASIGKLKASQSTGQLGTFLDLLLEVSAMFDQHLAKHPTQALGKNKKKRKHQGPRDSVNGIVTCDDTTDISADTKIEDVTSDDEEVGEPRSAIRRRRLHETSEDPSEEVSTMEETPGKKKKKLLEDSDAKDMRERARMTVLMQEARRKKLHDNLARSGHGLDEERGQIIINDAKSDNQGCIYVTKLIARRIKKHQIEGVRFLWYQIVGDEKITQGCLLAHTMGLGKTMQAITLLVAIAEASVSSDPSVVSQIPDRFRTSRSLILCPPGLIDNWMDELLLWAPKGLLGNLVKLDSTLSRPARLHEIDQWYTNGGILVIGYEMFRMLVLNAKWKLSKEQHDLVYKQLLEGPTIIIADEAHTLKNAEANVTQVAGLFKSKSRIALTGSPLANNIEEYHSMINWVSPNYLGPIAEFRQKYVVPIETGLWQDSEPYERRKCLKMLGVLKVDIAPKVNRADMSVLRNDLPPKREFVITVPLTDLQRKAYSLYVNSMTSSKYTITKDGEIHQSTLWHWLSVLGLLCNHPACFKAKLEKRSAEAKSKSKEGASGEETGWKAGVSDELVSGARDLLEHDDIDLKSPHLSNKVEILCQILDAARAAKDKVLVFSHKLDTLDFLQQLCVAQGRSYSRLDGKTKISSRQEHTKRFNEGHLELYLISTSAGGLGLNLPGANRVVIFDFKFNPILEEQAIGRAYRIGQQKATFVYRLICGGTFEDTVHNKIVFKTQLASRVVDKKNVQAKANKKVADFLFEPREVGQKDLSDVQGLDPHVLDKILPSSNGTIRAIVQSDSLEMHDDDKLTAEEEQEVKQMLDDEKLKRTDLKAWKAKNRILVEKPVAYHVSNMARNMQQMPILPAAAQWSPQNPNAADSTSNGLQEPRNFPLGVHLQAPTLGNRRLKRRTEYLPGQVLKSESDFRKHKSAAVHSAPVGQSTKQSEPTSIRPSIELQSLTSKTNGVAAAKRAVSTDTRITPARRQPQSHQPSQSQPHAQPSPTKASPGSLRPDRLKPPETRIIPQQNPILPKHKPLLPMTAVETVSGMNVSRGQSPIRASNTKIRSPTPDSILHSNPAKSKTESTGGSHRPSPQHPHTNITNAIATATTLTKTLPASNLAIIGVRQAQVNCGGESQPLHGSNDESTA